MTMFPTLNDLAAAPEQDLLKAWEGLGYYSRVRNMQKAAIQVRDDYNGVWPDTMAELENLTGIGPYTAAAIASISFKEPVPAIDGNAFRVFARLFKIDADTAQHEAAHQLGLAGVLLPESAAQHSAKEGKAQRDQADQQHGCPDVDMQHRQCDARGQRINAGGNGQQ